MTLIARKIRGHVAGDSLTIQRTVTDVPATDTLEYAWLTIKENKSDTDAEAALQVEIDLISQTPGHITDDGADGTGAIQFNLSAAETAALGYDITYHYDIQVKLASAKIDTPEIGTLRFRRGYTDATS